MRQLFLLLIAATLAFSAWTGPEQAARFRLPALSEQVPCRLPVLPEQIADSLLHVLLYFLISRLGDCLLHF